MLTLTLILILVSILSIASLYVALAVSYRYGKMLIAVEDNIQSCINIVNERTTRFEHIFDDTPGVVSDDPYVRRFIDEVNKTKNDVLQIASILSAITDSEEIEEDETSTMDEQG